MVANVEQADYWDDHGQHWVRNAERYDGQLAPFVGPLLDAAELTSGDRVLDVGCGFGTTTIGAAKAVDPGGAGLGVDLSEPMLALARQRAAAEGLDWVRFRRADAQVDRFDGDRYDAIISRFGVMFFSDPVAAFANLAQALAAGGRLAFTCFQPLDRNPWMTVPRGALAQFFDFPRPEPGAPGPFSLSDPERLRSLLQSAGLNAELQSLEVDMLVAGGGDLDDAVEFLSGGGMARDAVRSLDDATRARALAAVRDALAPHVGPDGVVLPAAAWLVTARVS